MAILNYTTTISVDKSAAEIQKKLVRAQARAVMNEYGSDAILSSISFRLETSQGTIHYRMPANVDGVLKALISQKVQKSHRTREHAAKVAWRICKDWIEAQLAIIEAQMASLDQVFLPYAITGTGETVYERFKNEGGNAIGITYQQP